MRSTFTEWDWPLMMMVRSREPEGPLTRAVMPLSMTVMDGAAAGAAAGAVFTCTGASSLGSGFL